MSGVEAKCSEGCTNHEPISFSLYSGFDESPAINFMVMPDMYHHDYSGGFVFEVKLEDLLKDAVSVSLDFDRGEGAHKITRLLRKYADKLDNAAIEFKNSKKNRPANNED